MLLATDLDGTFLGGTDADRTLLYDIIRENKDLRLVFVTGRGVNSVLQLLEESRLPLPRPEYIICDVGATVTHLETMQMVEPIQSRIAALWPGEQVRERMAIVNGLIQEDTHQQFRCTFRYDEGTDIAHAKALTTELSCDLLLSAGTYLDIMPKGVNKGYTLQKLLAHLGVPEEDVLIAGDTMNDFAMYETGITGVVVGGAEEELVNLTAHMPHVLQTQREGAAGILEAMSMHRAFAAIVENLTIK
ncbi:HAD-superfamily hydrolase, subfamily IIB [Chitinophaga jiangningensis]|uniref:HAD-superfamily hydrolase, subfamily IIB n=1 Tax=Chitinophaga jiangningensis TaxID=1419482 RepID=A0A1M7DS15_9BACT|nr:HAD-IIB family hydrolase [Chitinophaga jiangningensis]SHL82256.1 HAD-superfamily hydrolase, subfamily IIB [Chitinophaga jiangningensis]